jgi:hypothetical protein
MLACFLDNLLMNTNNCIPKGAKRKRKPESGAGQSLRNSRTDPINTI